MGTRSAPVEKHLKDNARHKTLIFVLNKVCVWGGELPVDPFGSC